MNRVRLLVILFALLILTSCMAVVAVMRQSAAPSANGEASNGPGCVYPAETVEGMTATWERVPPGTNISRTYTVEDWGAFQMTIEGPRVSMHAGQFNMPAKLLNQFSLSDGEVQVVEFRATQHPSGNQVVYGPFYLARCGGATWLEDEYAFPRLVLATATP